MSGGRIPPALARRLDRLSARAHLFHRYAHHPLCPAYAAETVRLGRRARVCRGCAVAALGAAAGIGFALALPLPSGPALLGAAALLPPFLVAAVRPRGGGRAPGLRTGGKLLTRGAPACAAAAIALLGLRSASLPGVTATALALASTGWAVRAYRRRGPDRAPCEACPERSSPETCSGFRPIAGREAAFARVAGRLLRAVPPPPPLR